MKACRIGKDRGSVLLIAMVLVAVLGVVALALVRRNTNEINAVSAKRHYDKSVSCAEAGREMLLSQFRVFGLDPASLVLNTHVGDLNVSTGHYDRFGIRTVVASSATGGSSVGVSDAANRLGSPLGGSSYRFTVVCADSAGSHQSEVEYDVRFGL